MSSRRKQGLVNTAYNTAGSDDIPDELLMSDAPSVPPAPTAPRDGHEPSALYPYMLASRCLAVPGFPS